MPTYPGDEGQADEELHHAHEDGEGGLPVAEVLGELVDEARRHRLKHTELRVESEDKQHEEEDDGPELGDGQLGQRLRVHHERQARACRHTRMEG